MAVPLTVHNAEIRTATVEIRTLTISGKQVTMAVFRQLQEERLVDHDGSFIGLPWGTVNYHPDKSCTSSEDNRPHVHVVWQKGTDLRRCCFRKPHFEPWFSPPSLLNWYDIFLVEAPERAVAYYKNGEIVLPADNLNCYAQPSRDSLTRLLVQSLMEEASAYEYLNDTEPPNADTSEWIRSQYENTVKRHNAAVSAVTQFRGELGDVVAKRGWSLQELIEQTRGEMAAELRRRDRHRDRWAEVLSLPQLFIAV
jgi:hypothetical protein